jgi:hypothetical protein
LRSFAEIMLSSKILYSMVMNRERFLRYFLLGFDEWMICELWNLDVYKMECVTECYLYL